MISTIIPNVEIHAAIHIDKKHQQQQAKVETACLPEIIRVEAEIEYRSKSRTILVWGVHFHHNKTIDNVYSRIVLKREWKL